MSHTLIAESRRVRLSSTALLYRLPGLHSQPINLVVSQEPSGTCAPGELIWRGDSRLDAFSGSPVRTSLPSDAVGTTTGTPAVRPSRSSRTKDSPSQLSTRPRQIGTELSHDVLNPARVPL